MKDKKVIVLIVLTIFAVISVGRGIMAPAKKRYAPSISAAAVSPAGPAAPKSGLVVERRARKSKFTSWKRSPFVPSGATSSSGLVLNGIIWSKTNPKAMIDGAIVAKGDRTGSCTVVEIRPDCVVLNDGAKTFEIKLEK